MRYLVVLFIVLTWSCQFLQNNGQGKIVARVHDKNLYASELNEMIPMGLQTEDSAEIAKDFINKWIRKQLLLNKAELTLSDEEKELERQIEEYRASLLIFKYEQNYLKNRLDTFVADTEIVAYYSENTPNFILDNHLVKGVYIRVPRDAAEIYKVRRWYRSSEPDDIEKLKLYCREQGAEYDEFRNQWLRFDQVAMALPEEISNVEYFLRYRGSQEMRDTSHHHFLTITDHVLSSTVAPVEYVEDDIRTIIINKRKIKLIQNLESNIYNDALNHNYFNIY
ncbi:MAG: hypothetical protein GVY19_09695 [Bacteroidetes bacterium]|jgi:hypothetical protein|nr:hypothetical protein [Bacteroidota bacterium]